MIIKRNVLLSWSEFAIARAYAQLRQEASKRPLSEDEQEAMQACHERVLDYVGDAR